MGSQSAQKHTSYDKNGNVTSTSEQDWDGTVLRQTVNLYWAETPDAGQAPVIGQANAYWNAGSARVYGAVKSTETSGGGGQTSYAEFGYDGAWNPVWERRWDNTKGARTVPLSGANSILTSRTYDLYGNLETQTDERGMVTSYG